jgi:lysophospholipase L1-like esterase
MSSVSSPRMRGASASLAGRRGLVPKPAAGDQNKFLRADGSYAAAALNFIGESAGDSVPATAGAAGDCLLITADGTSQGKDWEEGQYAIWEGTSGDWAQANGLLELDSPDFTGTPTAPTAPANTSTDQIATTAFAKALADAVQAAGRPQNHSLLSATAFQVPADRAVMGAGTGGLGGKWIAHDLNAGATAAQIVSASYGIEDDSAGANDIFLDTNTADIADTIINMHVSGTTRGAMALLRFSRSARNGYGVRFASGNLEIWRFDAGVGTVIGDEPVSAPTGIFCYYITVSGSTITATMLAANGWIQASATDTTYKSGFCGFRMGNTADELIRHWVAAPFPAIATHAVGAATISSYGWDVNGTTWMQSQNTGDSFVFGFSGPYCALNVEAPAGCTGYFVVTVDGVTYKRFNIVGNGSAAISVPIFHNENSLGVKNCRVVLEGNDSVTDNWTVPTNAFRVISIRTAAGYVLSAPVVEVGRIAVVGDSISRGRSITEGQWDYGRATASWPWLVAKKLAAEMNFIAFSGQGASSAGPGNVPAAKTAVLSHSNGRSRSPDSTVTRVYVAHGTNDGGVVEATLKADITTLWDNCRTQWPNAKIIVVLPLGYSTNAAAPSAVAVRDTYNGYISAAYAAWSDVNKQLIDLTGEAYGDSMPGPLNGGSNAYTADLIHPNAATNELIAAYIAAQ